MVRDAVYRINKWIAKMSSPDLTSFTSSLQMTNMTTQVRIMFPLLTALENAVKIVLAEEQIDVYQNLAYLNFARQVYSKRLRHHGSQLQNEVNIIMTKFVQKGFSQRTLERIRNVVFTLSLPPSR